MNYNRETAQEKITELVTRFDEQFSTYKQSSYNEAQTRQDFINPFFKALGWDIDNENGYAESYREVIYEDKVKVAGFTKAPDYSFRLVGGKRLFFVEAKKPSIVIKDDAAPAFQVRRYGWSAKLPVSIITDFEEFAVYDCTKKPLHSDKAATARIRYITYSDYIKEFDFIWNTFSKERVLKGSFDKFVQSDTYKKGTATVDNDFLQSLDSWRTYLATSIANHNKHLDEDEINFVVQQTIDRIIFLRIAEDRSVEPYGNLKDCINQGNLYQNLYKLFEKADEKYNSGLFDFNKDKISRNLEIDNKVIKTIITELYYPCPYAFSVLPVEILGTAYERFLGKVIRITPGHHAKIEDKPAVRKAGGVYYTPQYIVDYIVKNTVGKLIEGKNPKEISKIKIVDPACGSGSFLLGAYQYLLDYHKNYYTDNGKISKGTKSSTLTPAGNLTTAEKKNILLNNLFGVDIDINAVEVTKLSLLLKCMEGETSASIAYQLAIFHERILPNLEANIKSGNSLIDTDYYDNQLDFGDEKKIKPFNWRKAFSEVFNQGGFDAVIGNPPYGYMITPEQQNYFEHKYKFQDYQKDLYLLFLERYQNIIKERGCLGVIVSNTWLQSLTLKKIRSYLLSNYRWNKILLLPEKVFNAVVDTHVLIFTREKPTVKNSFEVEELISQTVNTRHSLIQRKIDSNGDPINISVNTDIKLLCEEIIADSKKLSDLADVFNGVKPFEKGKGIPPQTQAIVNEKPFVVEGKMPDKKWRPLLRGSLIRKYANLWKDNYWILYGEWLAAPRKPAIFDCDEKIMIRQTGDSLIATIIPRGFIARNNLHIIIPKISLNTKYLLGLMNSKLIDFVYTYINPEKGEVLAEVKKHHIEVLPIKEIDLKCKNEKSDHDEIIKNVVHLLKLNEEIQEAKLQSKIEQLKAHISHCEAKINEIVYRLYGLTDEEIKIVEGK